jgi:hypothetical protein
LFGYFAPGEIVFDLFWPLVRIEAHGESPRTVGEVNTRGKPIDTTDKRNQSKLQETDKAGENTKCAEANDN